MRDPGLVDISGKFLYDLTFRFYKNALPPYAMYGGIIAFTYQFIYDFMNHHETNNDRPMFFNHLLATTTIMTVGSGIYGGLPTHALTGFILAIFLVGPMTWWFHKQGRVNANSRPSNIFYENSVTPEEVERI